LFKPVLSTLSRQTAQKTIQSQAEQMVALRQGMDDLKALLARSLAPGPSRHRVATQQFGRFRSKANILRAAMTVPQS
jgi:hypothetical protein